VIPILHVVTSLGRGGAERALADLVTHADAARFRHIVCYLHGPHDLADELRAAGVEPICLDAPSRRGWIAAARKLPAVIAEREPALVQSVTFEANLAARLAARGRGLPLLSWLVSMEYDPASVRAAGWSRRSNAARRWLDSWSARLSGARFVACSDAVRGSAITRMGIAPDRIETIYNPVDLGALQPQPGEAEALRRELGLPDDAFVYFNVGRMDAPKAQGLLIEAFAQVAGEQPDAVLVILGRGGLQAELRRQAVALGVAERVRFAGGAPRIAPFLALADIFVFPSLLEGLPVALLEAMCAGVPAIASDIAPHVEVVDPGVTGLLARAGSAEALARRMREHYADPAQRRTIAAAARAAAVGRFSTATIVPQWQALYARMALPSRSPA
jgi:glycosyltransferase involved in cell wall biosynthesis